MTQAIFLSYASQDADAARRICEALRAAGLEVWFDQSELRGGDAWDASIRKQIKECALFVPIISRNTQEREEGYFRLEWKLAVDRSHLMADDKAFFFPVVLDDVAEPKARVPDKFRERQWSRLNDHAATTMFAERIAKLLAGRGVSGKSASNTPPNSLPRTGSGGDLHNSATISKPVAPLQNGAQASTILREQTNLDPGAVTKLSRDDSIKGFAGPNRDVPSIAVLAFANRSASADDEYFSDGLADELLNVLAKIKGLRVVARTSSFAFKGKSDDIATIGAKLNVATLLEGSVRKSGNRVRISVQLVKVADSAHLWSETYDRTLDDIFAVQDDIAQAVVQQLRATLLGEAPSSVTEVANEVAKEIAHASRARSDNPEAQRLIMQARFYMNKRRPDDIKRGIELCEQAIAIDPEHANAHATIALAWLYSAFYGSTEIPDGTTVLAQLAKARTAAEHALRLDPMQATPHTTLSWIACIRDQDRATGMREAVTAQQLAPDDAEVLRTLGHRLMEAGQFAESEAVLSRAVKQDPLSIQLRIIYSTSALWMGQPQVAQHRIRDALAIDQASWIAHTHLSRTLSELGDFPGAVEAFAHSRTLRGEHEAATYFRQHFATNGWTGYLSAVVAAPHFGVTRLQIARAEVELGRIDDAFVTLNSIVDNHDQSTGLLHQEPGLKPLHGDPRYVALLKRAGFI